jgi:hypothetical protein
MRNSAQLSRRDTLFILSAIAGFGAAGLTTVKTESSVTIGSVLFALFPDLRQARSLSKACLGFFPKAISPDRLYRQLVQANSYVIEHRATIADLRLSIKQRVQTDFTRGDIVQVNGWMLSFTELSLYALAALIAPAATLPTDVS